MLMVHVYVERTSQIKVAMLILHVLITAVYHPLHVHLDGILMKINAIKFVQIIVKQEMLMVHVYAVKTNLTKVVILFLHVLITLAHCPKIIQKDNHQTEITKHNLKQK
jgi:hypothetical protein